MYGPAASPRTDAPLTTAVAADYGLLGLCRFRAAAGCGAVGVAAADWFRKGTSGPKPRERVVVHFGGAC